MEEKLEGKNYRITIESISDDKEKHKVPDEIRGGVDCDGFVIMFFTDDKGAVVIHETNLMKICSAMHSNEHLAKASALLGIIGNLK